MSLINEMLRDLDRRGGAPSDIAPPASHRAQRNGSSYPLRFGLVVAVLMVIAGFTAVWFWLDAETTPATPQEPPSAEEWTHPKAPDELASAAARPSDTPAMTDALGAVSAPTVAGEALNQPEPTSGQAPEPAQTQSGEPKASGSEVIDASPDGRVQALLAQAREARERDRLTRPAGDNAYEYYQQVLALHAEHPQALAGLAAVAQRYRELAEAAMDRGALSAAQRFLRRARSVAPELSGIQGSEGRLQRMQQAQSTPGAAEPSTEEPESSALSVRRDPATDDRRRAEQARQWWARQQQTRARHFLEQTLAQWPESAVAPVHSAAALIEFYLQSDDLDQAERQLSQSEAYLPEDERARLWAELWSARGDQAQALKTLEQAASQAQKNEPFRALWARLNYAQGNHAVAGQHYQQLLADFGGKAAYWLGLGLAADAQQQAADAQRAFEQALRSGAYDDNPSIRRYLEGRLNSLARQLNHRNP